MDIYAVPRPLANLERPSILHRFLDPCLRPRIMRSCHANGRVVTDGFAVTIQILSRLIDRLIDSLLICAYCHEPSLRIVHYYWNVTIASERC